MKTTLTKDDPAGWYLCYMQGLPYVRWWDSQHLYLSECKGVCEFEYTNFRRLFTEADVAELRRFEEYAKGRIELLESELAALRKQPYSMRKADKPDCVGLWLTTDDRVFPVGKNNLDPTFWAYPPYYYLGPIPVIPKEQQPPKVVKVRCKKTGEVCRAIPSPCGYLLAIIDDDGTFLGSERAIDWEVVQ